MASSLYPWRPAEIATTRVEEPVSAVDAARANFWWYAWASSQHDPGRVCGMHQKTDSAPANPRFKVSTSSREPLMTSQASRTAAGSLSGVCDTRRTVSPRSNSIRTTCEPVRPLGVVTVIIAVSLCGVVGQKRCGAR